MEDLHIELEKYLYFCENQKQLSKYTLKAYRIDLIQYADNKSNLSKDNLTEYILSLHNKYKPKSVKRKIASLKAFVHYLYCNDIIEQNPFDKIDTSFREPQILPRIIPGHIISSMLYAAYENIKSANSDYEKFTTVRNTAVIELLFATGARISEICSLKCENIDLFSHTIKILGKGSKERIISIENKDVLNVLHQYKSLISERLHPHGFFFLNNRLSRLSEQSVRIVINNLVKQAKAEIHITPHMFRHSVATMLLEEDVDIRYIQHILGHSSITTTQIYTHVASFKQKEILRMKHPRNKMILK